MVDYSRDTLFLMQQVYATLFSLGNKLQVKGDEYLEGLTSRQLMAMIAIIHLPEDGRTLNNIARKLGTTKQNVKQLISNVEKKGYVASLPSKKDKRSYNVKITRSGGQAMQDLSENSLHFFTDVFKGFKKEELETLWSLLKRLYRFDGEAMDGFEEEIEFKVEGNKK